jgi:formiminotetrahydrofolate cyclodeaminase
MTNLAARPLAQVLDEVAAATPAPGGGASAACTCALAAALVQMAAGIGGTAPDVVDRARALRARALELAEADLSAYAPVLVARRLARDDPQRGARIESALTEASSGPTEIAEAAAETAELATQIAHASNPAVRGDAVTGAVLAEAAAAAAATLVEINLHGRDGDAVLERARGARRRAHDARAAAEGP